jgi:steroid delta-isomerase-like uncharacterized protein
MSEQNKAAARRFFEAWSSGDLDAYDEIMAADYQDHDTQNPNAGIRGPEGAKRTAEMYRAAFPDTHFEVEAQFADGDYVITRWTASGTQEGELMGMPASGKRVEVTGIAVDRFEGGKIAEGWNNWDTLGMLQQLGAVPEAARA